MRYWIQGTVIPVYPETASFKHQNEVLLHCPIHTLTHLHIKHENDGNNMNVKKLYLNGTNINAKPSTATHLVNSKSKPPFSLNKIFL